MKVGSFSVLVVVVRNVSPNYELRDGLDGPFDEGDVTCLLVKN